MSTTVRTFHCPDIKFPVFSYFHLSKHYWCLHVSSFVLRESFTGDGFIDHSVQGTIALFALPTSYSNKQSVAFNFLLMALAASQTPNVRTEIAIFPFSSSDLPPATESMSSSLTLVMAFSFRNVCNSSSFASQPLFFRNAFSVCSALAVSEILFSDPLIS